MNPLIAWFNSQWKSNINESNISKIKLLNRSKKRIKRELS